MDNLRGQTNKTFLCFRCKLNTHTVVSVNVLKECERLILANVVQGLPSFGPYKKKRLEIVAKYKEQVDLLDDASKPEQVRPAVKPTKPAPTVKVGWEQVVGAEEKLVGQLIFVASFPCSWVSR